MELFLVCSSLIISVIAVIVSLIIIWQYVTGREYWGEHRCSLVGPITVGSIVPMVNLIIWCAIIIFAVIGLCVYGMSRLRERAVEKREQKEREQWAAKRNNNV